MGYLINLSGSGLATFLEKQDLMDKNLESSIRNVKNNYPNRFEFFLTSILRELMMMILKIALPF